MGWLSDLTGKTPHKGQVVVTRSTGVSTTFKDLDKAEEACGDLKGKLKYFRGAFFEHGVSRRADAEDKAWAKAKADEPAVPGPDPVRADADAPAAESTPAPLPAASKPKPSGRRRRRGSEPEGGTDSD